MMIGRVRLSERLMLLRKNECANVPRISSCFYTIFFLALIVFAAAGSAQTAPESPYYARGNSFGIFTAYSNDSSPMLLGIAENRKLFDVGASYSRRLFLNRIVNWQYSGELLPVALESDPVQNSVTTYTTDTTPPMTYTESISIPTVLACHPSTGSGSFPGFYSYTYVSTCGRRWTIGEAMSPVGFQWNFLTRRTMQPFFIGHGGYMYSTQPIPAANAGSFNFTVDLGAGLELYRSKTKSIRAEYRYHHISNHGTATENPGIDNGLFQVTYAFGR
jgi:opacity protein-like surface antigen